MHYCRTGREALGTGVGVQEVHVFVGKADTNFHTVILPTVVPMGQGF